MHKYTNKVYKYASRGFSPPPSGIGNYYPRSSTPKSEPDLVSVQRRRSPRDLSAILALCLSL